MPINIPYSLPASRILEQENIFVMNEERAVHQDIRPLRIAILNLMPKKIETETQLLRLLSNSPLQVDIELLQMSTHSSKNTSAEHLLKFYKTFADIREERFDGLIITGAPVEQLPFEAVDYWPELCAVMDWSLTNVYSTFFICWGAQAGLFYYYGIQKQPLAEKMFGIFPHHNLSPSHKLMRGFDEVFFAPHSRHTGIAMQDILKESRLELLSYSDEAGPYLIASRDNRQIFVTGHSEYDRNTLAEEYFRDRKKGIAIQPPRHYFPQDDPNRAVPHQWRSHAHLLYSNWLNYFVYQSTPYDLKELPLSHGL